MNLNLPVDFERLTEFRMLCGALQSASTEKTSLPEAEMVATRMLLRLWVDLAYLAQSTNRPGWLTTEGKALYVVSLEPFFAEDAEPVKLLIDSGCLKQVEGELFCERFARLNAHFAGDYQSPQQTGAARSAVIRQRGHIAGLANQQIMLLPESTWKLADGAQMDASQIQRCVMVIMTLDRCLKLKQRAKNAYSEGLIRDASQVAERYGKETLEKFYTWLQLKRDQVWMPKSTEQILARFEEIVAMSQS